MKRAGSWISSVPTFAARRARVRIPNVVSAGGPDISEARGGIGCLGCARDRAFLADSLPDFPGDSDQQWTARVARRESAFRQWAGTM